MSASMSTPINENESSPGNAPAPLKKRSVAESPEATKQAMVTSPEVSTSPEAMADLVAASQAVASPEAMATPVAASEEEAPKVPEESEESRMKRETLESECLARMLMAQEAEASFALQYEMLQSATADMNDADLVAVQALLRADEEMQNAMQPHQEAPEGEDGEDEEEEEETADDGANYDHLIELGRAIGDVKAERWAFRAQSVIDSLPVCVHSTSAPGAYDTMCIFCQDDFSPEDKVRQLPCKHGFHMGCVDEWLKANDSCPLCKAPVAPEDEAAEAKPPAPGLFN